jgi:hypothetical protein
VAIFMDKSAEDIGSFDTPKRVTSASACVAG